MRLNKALPKLCRALIKFNFKQSNIYRERDVDIIEAKKQTAHKTNIISQMRSHLANQHLDDEDVDDVLELLLEQLPKMTQEIRIAIEKQNKDKLRSPVHSFKGMFSNLGAKVIINLCLATEKTIDSDNDKET